MLSKSSSDLAMPELPEVEATRRHLAPVVTGSVVERIEIRRDRMIRRQPRPGDVVERMPGRRIVSVGRHGKFLLTLRVSGSTAASQNTISSPQ